MDTDMSNLLVAPDGAILEATRTGVVIECEASKTQLELFHFKNTAAGISGLAIGPDFEAIIPAYTDGRYTQVDSDFTPSVVVSEQYERAKLAGMQALAMSNEVAASYTLIGTYLNGISAAFSENHKSMKELVNQHDGNRQLASQHPEFVELNTEAERLDELQDAAFAARETIMRDSQAYKMGYGIHDVPPAVVESTVQVQNYMLGLYVRQKELEDQVRFGMGDTKPAIEQLDLISQRYDQIDTISAQIEQSQAQVTTKTSRASFGM